MRVRGIHVCVWGREGQVLTWSGCLGAHARLDAIPAHAQTLATLLAHFACEDELLHLLDIGGEGSLLDVLCTDVACALLWTLAGRRGPWDTVSHIGPAARLSHWQHHL